MKKLNLLLTISFIAIWACNTSSEKTISSASGGTQSVLFKKPIKDFKIPAQVFSVETQTEQKIETSSGTQITIPSEAFETLEGNPVSGEIDIKFKEVRTPAEIMLSGINMLYNNGSETFQLQTAGMFEIRASVQGQVLRLKKNKSIDVNMPSTIDGDYSFFYLDEEKGSGWELLADASQDEIHISKNTADPEDTKAQIDAFELKLKQLKETKAPKKYNPKTDHLFDFEVDYSEQEELNKFKNLLWRFEQKPSKTEAQELASQTWTQKSLKKLDNKEEIYHLQLGNGKKTLDFQIEPIYVSKDYQLALNAFQKVQQDIEKAKDELKALKEKERATDIVYRSYSVSSLGWHNWDRIFKNPALVWLNGDFSFEGNDLNKSELRIYLVTENGSVVQQYDNINFDKMSYDPNKANALVAFTPDGSIGTFSSKNFQQIGFSPSTTSQKFTFDLKKEAVRQKDILGANDLDAIIARL